MRETSEVWALQQPCVCGQASFDKMNQFCYIIIVVEVPTVFTLL